MCQQSAKLPSTPYEYSSFANIFKAAAGRVIFRTDTGHVGRSSLGPQEDDLLAGLFGIDVPFVLQRASRNEYTMVNVGYILDHILSPAKESRDLRFRRRKRKVIRYEKLFNII
jgi:hypothetical protein